MKKPYTKSILTSSGKHRTNTAAALYFYLWYTQAVSTVFNEVRCLPWSTYLNFLNILQVGSPSAAFAPAFTTASQQPHSTHVRNIKDIIVVHFTYSPGASRGALSHHFWKFHHCSKLKTIVTRAAVKI
jgi:hypothetical protein